MARSLQPTPCSCNYNGVQLGFVSSLVRWRERHGAFRDSIFLGALSPSLRAPQQRLGCACRSVALGSHAGPILGLAFGPAFEADGATAHSPPLLSAGADGTVRLWSTGSLGCTVLRPHGGVPGPRSSLATPGTTGWRPCNSTGPRGHDDAVNAFQSVWRFAFRRRRRRRGRLGAGGWAA